MLYFENDYSEGAHEKVLARLVETNMEQLSDMAWIHTVNRQRKKYGEPVTARRQTSIFLQAGLRRISA